MSPLPTLKKTLVFALFAGSLAVMSPLAARAAHDFTVVDKSSHPIKELYLSNVDQNDWGPNQLDSPIASGDKRTWSIPAAECKQDVKIVYDDDHSQVLPGVDTCTVDLDADY